MIAVCCGYLIAPMGMASVNVAIPTLADELNATALQVGWLPTLYLLGNVAFILPCGKLADIYGRKRMYVIGLCLNVLASLLCAVADSMYSLLFWRLVQGISGAMIFGTGIAIVSSVTSQEKRGAALGIVASSVYIGLTAAPAAGGYLTESLGWRAVFYFQIPFIVCLLVFIFLALKGDWKTDSHTTFDWSGSIQFIVFSCFLVYGLTSLPTVIGLLCLLGACIIFYLFIRHQNRISQPLIRIALFKSNRLFSLSLLTSFFMYASSFTIIFLLSLYLQYIKALSPSKAGEILLVQAFCMALIAPIAGKLADRFEARIIATAGCICVAIGYGFINQIDSQTSNTFIVVSLAIIGLGFGLFSTPNNNAIMAAVHHNELGFASSSMNLARTVGNLFGMSLVNLLLNHYLGNIAINNADAAFLMVTISSALSLSLSMALMACLFSSFRGRQLL